MIRSKRNDAPDSGSGDDRSEGDDLPQYDPEWMKLFPCQAAVDVWRSEIDAYCQ
jgi:hypothetical protein